MEEPRIIVQHREELAELLTEAAEVEHNLMCCYLFAAWSLKRGEDEGLTAAQARDVALWRRDIIHVAIDEMTHLANVSNLLSAIGGRPHFGRPNFPVSPGYHPAGVVVELRRFEASTIDHFVYLERPEGVALPDGEGFASPAHYQRGISDRILMPTAQDYETVGHLYRGIRDGLAALSATLGEAALFCGDPTAQISPALVQLQGLVAVTDLASAQQAVDNIVLQGEGNADNPEGSHYRLFCGIRDALAAHQQQDPAFDPARPVVRSPVQRRPPVPAGKTWIGHPEAAAILDLCNALYNHMLRCLGAAYEDVGDGARAGLLDEAIGLMQALVPLNDLLTRLPPSDTQPAARAGMSFAITRDVRIPTADAAAQVLAERTRGLAVGARYIAHIDPVVAAAADALEQAAVRLDGLPPRTARTAPSPVSTDADADADADAAAPPAAAAAEPGALEYSTDPTIPPRRIEDGVEVIEGEKLTLRFDGKRCIHARFCVLGAPEVFVGNVQGPWIRPDAIDVEALAGVAHRCPSGAITYSRKDARPDEAPPSVNTAHIRENGPYALQADLHIDGEAPRLRATLCRCGASKRKPFCDGSHHDIDFQATGEPATGDVQPLVVRDGVVSINPTRDGPLAVTGNLEICAGTGRTVAKVTRARLCRCGGSQSKPFCDGTHRAIGFKS